VVEVNHWRKSQIKQQLAQFMRQL